MKLKRICISLLLCIGMLILVGKGVSASDVFKELAWWKFDGDATDETGVFDLSPYNATEGTYVDGKLGQAAMFETSGFNLSGFSPDYSSYSLAFWVWLNSSSLNPNHYIYNNGIGNYEQSIIYDNQTNHRLTFSVGTGAAQARVRMAIGENETDSWLHIVYIANTTGLFVYTNGTLYNTTAVGSPPAQTETNLSVGVRPAIAQESTTFLGKLDDFRIFLNYSLDLADIEFLYNDGVGTTESINPIYIDMCQGKTNTTTLNITFVDEATNLTVNTTTEFHFEVWSGNKAVYENFSFSSIRNESIEFCIHPITANYTADFDIVYNNTGYDTREYNVRDYNLDNEIDYLLLYLLDSDASTEITITVQDEFENALPNVIVESHKYILSTDSYNLVSIEITDENGIVKVNLDTEYKYKFIIKDQDGETLYTSATMTLFDAAYTFLVRPEAEHIYSDLLGLDRTLTFPQDAPHDITYTWNDNSGLTTQVCLSVANSTINDTIQMYEACSTGTEGTLSYTVVATSGFYVATGYAYATADGLRYVLDSESLTLRTAYDIWGSEGMLMAGIFIGTMTFIGIGIAAVSTAGGIIAIILMMFSSIVMMIMGMVNIGVGGIILLILMGVAVIIVISKKET